MKDLDPNVLVPALIALATWAWHKLRGEKTASLRDQLDAVITTAVHRIFADDALIERARVLLEAEAYALLARVNITRSKAVEAIVKVAIEEGLAELAELVTDHKRTIAELTRGLELLNSNAKGVAKAFDEQPTKPMIPRHDPDAPPEVFEELREPARSSLQVYGNDPEEPALPGLDATVAAAAAKVRAALAKGKGG